MTDFDTHFSRAKKLSTLERMVMAKVRELKIRFDPACESLLVVADCYKRLGHHLASDMLMAAYRREQYLEDHRQAETPQPCTSATHELNTASDTLQQEMQDWFTKNSRAST